MDESNPPRRRRFQFSLRGLLIGVTLLAAFIGWLTREYQFVQQRKAAILASDDDNPALILSVKWSKQTHGWWAPGTKRETSDPEPTIPFWRRWLGDEAVAVVGVDHPYSEELLAELHRLFPEARDFSMEPIHESTSETPP